MIYKQNLYNSSKNKENNTIYTIYMKYKINNPL